VLWKNMEKNRAQFQIQILALTGIQKFKL